MNPVVVRPAAEDDIEAAYLWYEGRQAYLGNEFLFAIRSALFESASIPRLTPSSIPMFAEWWCRGASSIRSSKRNRATAEQCILSLRNRASYLIVEMGKS